MSDSLLEIAVRRPTLWTIFAASAVAVTAWTSLSAAQSVPKNPGDEVAVGPNQTGEPCRLRMMDNPGSPASRFNLYCAGWTQRSAVMYRGRASREYPPRRLLMDSAFEKDYSRRLSVCQEAESTTLSDGTAAALRECKWTNGGWPMLVLATVVNRESFMVETLPTNLPVIERALEVLSGKRKVDAIANAGGGSRSAAIRRAETMVGASGALVGVQDIGAHDTLVHLGELRYESGDEAGSEAAFRRALEIEERLLGKDRPASGRTLTYVARATGYQERFEESEALFVRALPLVQASFVADHYPEHLAVRSGVERFRGRSDEALRLAEESVRIREARNHPNDTGLAHGLYHLGFIYNNLGRYGEAEAAANRALRIVQQAGSNPDWRQYWFGECQQLLGLVLTNQKKYAEARKAFEASRERRELLFGETRRVAQALGQTARVARLQGDLPIALAAFRGAAAIIAKDPVARAAARPDGITAYLDTILDAVVAAPADRDALFAEAFAAAQIPESGQTALAITNMAARLANADPAVQAATRDYQEATRERERVRRALARQTLKAADDESGVEGGLKEKLRAAEERVAALESVLQAKAPRYMRLTAAAPVTATELGTLLRPDEALVAFLPTARSTYVFVVRSGVTTMHRAAIGRSGLDRDVKALRKGLELTEAGLPAFDVALARQLYGRLIEPVADHLNGVRHLVTVPAGPLLSLPLGALVTAAADVPAVDDYRNTAWLGRQFAMSTLPSVASLKDLRAVSRASAAAKPFIGFGDPAFTGAAGDRRSAAAIGALCRQGEALDTELVRTLPRLRETATELRQIAHALGAPTDSVVLGADVTEARVRAANLSDYKVIAFATHGLLPSELKCKAEPALALTPPAIATAAEDGLLDASEIAQLRLDADWVVLSACNTAGPDGNLGGESLSGLARAFFYAGARSLLVSHWAVASRATVALTTGMFSTYAKSPTQGRAAALAQAQRALQDDKDTSHPFFWAPFVLVGDGGGAPGP